MQALPDDATDLLEELLEMMQEAHDALEHDMNVFDEALQTDLEDLQGIKDQLKIQSITKKLKQK